MPGAKSCACNWEYVGPRLGSVWFRGKFQSFVAVRPNGEVVGVDYPTRQRAIFALAQALERPRRVATVALNRSGVEGGAAKAPIRLSDYRSKLAEPPANFAQGIVSMLSWSGRMGN